MTADIQPSELAIEIEAWAAQGEGQNLEFKRELPSQVSKIAKEIAAFATSNAGVILVGVCDDGEIVGVESLDTQAGRTLFFSRLEGICSNVIEPTITPTIEFGEVRGKSVAVVRIPKGLEPVYYAQSVPYLRQITAARVAKPEEVRGLVEAWVRANEPDKPSADLEFLNEVMHLLVAILAQTEDFGEEDRLYDPWFPNLQFSLQLWADQARELASRAPNSLGSIAEALDRVADPLDVAASEDVGLNFGYEEVGEAIQLAREVAQSIKAKWIDPHLTDIFGDRRTEEVQALSRRLSGEAARAESSVRSRGSEKLKAVLGEIGKELIVQATFGRGLGGARGIDIIRDVGLRLRLLETHEILGDGGASTAVLVAGARAASATLAEFLDREFPNASRRTSEKST